MKFGVRPNISLREDSQDSDAVDGLVLYFTAGIAGESHGLFGIIKPAQQTLFGQDM